MKIKHWLAIAAAAVSVAVTAGSADAADKIRVGEGPFITGGGVLIAREKGYFQKLGLEVEIKNFIDGALAVPSLVAGELDLSFMTPNASLFNSVAKGAPIVVILDRGNNRKGRAYTLVNVTQALYDQGVKSMADFAKLKGKKIGVGALGSINQFNMAQALLKAGLDPTKDVEWVVNVAQPDLMKMLGTGGVDATDLAWQFGVIAQNNKWGPIVATGDEMVPDAPIGVIVARKPFLDQNRDVVVRFAMAYLHAVKEFNAAAAAPDKHQDIVNILARTTALNKPEVVKGIAPNWSYINEDGEPLTAKIMEIQDFWGGGKFKYVEKKVSQEQLFDSKLAKEAVARLAKDNPFGK